MDDETMKPLKEGQRVFYQGKAYDFGYVSHTKLSRSGSTTRAVIYEVGERNMQDSIVVDLEDLSIQ